MQTSKSLFCIGFVYPEPKASAAGSRLLQLLTSFLNNGYDITFGTTAKISENAADLTALGIKIIPLKLNCASFDDLLIKLNPKIVLFDRFLTEEQFGWRVAEHCPNAIRILDSEDLHFLRHSREKLLNSDADFLKTVLSLDHTKREIASLYRCDLTLIISEVEYDLLTKQFQIDPSLLIYIPFIFSANSLPDLSSLMPFEDRKNFVFIGNFLHKPNANAVRYLKEVIWPKLNKILPEAELHIYGAYAKPKHLALTNSFHNFYVHGFATDSNLVIQSARVMLSPLQFGAGLKGKIFDAILNGTPCAMSSIAAEGIFDSLVCNGFIEDDPDLFIEKAAQLYVQKELWLKYQTNGLNVLSNRFEDTVFLEKMFNYIQYLSKELESHRLQNFTGIMLNHQSLQSNKYFSKWIEAKTKLNSI